MKNPPSMVDGQPAKCGRTLTIKPSRASGISKTRVDSGNRANLKTPGPPVGLCQRFLEFRD